MAKEHASPGANQDSTQQISSCGGGAGRRPVTPKPTKPFSSVQFRQKLDQKNMTHFLSQTLPMSRHVVTSRCSALFGTSLSVQASLNA